jgi:hypothetical protein
MGVLSHQRSALRLKGNTQGTTLFMLAQDKLEYSICDDCKIETLHPAVIDKLKIWFLQCGVVVV